MLVSRSAPAQSVTDIAGDAHLPVPSAGESEEDSPLKEQLNKAWKRIADLETRIHDLTLQSTMVSAEWSVFVSHT